MAATTLRPVCFCVQVTHRSLAVITTAAEARPAPTPCAFEPPSSSPKRVSRCQVALTLTLILVLTLTLTLTLTSTLVRWPST